MTDSHADDQPLIAVYLVTYRRNVLLRRALTSVLAQYHRNLVVRVVNDDPTDAEVSRIVEETGDNRARMYLPLERRGATRSFNLMLSEADADYVSLLEDDNWWEPEFLSRMLENLRSNPDIPVVVGNELIWRETEDESWINTDKTIWHFRDLRRFSYALPDICGHATICNSSMLLRLPMAQGYVTPEDIPVDVTEHFRERQMPSTILLDGRPLVNYAETLRTARRSDEVWGQYMNLSIGSAFVALERAADRRKLALELWSRCPSPTSPRAVSLIATGLAFREASSLLRHAPPRAIARGVLWLVRRPTRWRTIGPTRSQLAEHMAFLVEAPLTQELASKFAAQP